MLTDDIKTTTHSSIASRRWYSTSNQFTNYPTPTLLFHMTTTTTTTTATSITTSITSQHSPSLPTSTSLPMMSSSVGGSLLVLSFVVTIHELGHYMAARSFGMNVTEFSVGIGPKIFGFTALGNDFSLRAFPLGGYVRFPENYNVTLLEQRQEEEMEKRLNQFVMDDDDDDDYDDDDDDDVKIYRTIEESESESERVDSNDDLYDDNETTEAPAVVKVLPFVNSEARAKARRQATIKRQRRKLQKQQVASKLAFQEERLRQALMEGERVREQCKSQEYRMAQTIVQSLENRLQQVDDLIETLQEEEWADEEEFGANNNSSNVNNDDESKTVSNWFSLLDQILAMILGTIPIPQGKSQEEHFQFIKIEHTRIVQQWKSHFGRLPPMLSSKLTNIDGVNDTYSEHDLVDDVTNLTLDALNVTIVSDEAKPDSFELRTMLGITDNNEEWDSMDVWDVALPKLARPVIATDVKAPSTKAKSGLRPGGSVQ